MANLPSALYEAFDEQDVEAPLRFLSWLVEDSELNASSLHVLDMGCGPGRMLQPFSEQGWRVTAMEPNAEYRARAEEKCADLADAEIRAGGWSDLHDVERFDLIVALNGPFAYLVSEADRSDALDRTYAALNAGGVLFLELPNMLSILYNYRPPVVKTRQVAGKTVRLHRHHEIDFHRAIFRTLDHFTLADPDGSCQLLDQVHEYAMTTPEEFRYLLRESGFEDVLFYNDYSARSPEVLRSGGRMHISARKPA